MLAKRSFFAVVLAAGILAVAAKQEKRPSFADWLSLSTKAGPQAVPSYGDYGPVDTVDACLRAVAKRGCWDTSTVWGLGCCHDHHDGKGLDFGKALEVGECDFTETIVANVAISEKVAKVAKFVAQCTLNDKCDTCGHPFVDKMVLNAFGTKYEFKNAIVSPYYETPTVGEDCGNSLWPNWRAGKTVPAKIAYAYGGDEYEHHGNFTEVPRAFVYHGTMTINSRLHDIKYHDGIFQFVGPIDTEGARAVSPEEAKNTYVLDPYRMELSFFKPKEY